MQNHADIVIVGAGVAGLMTTLALTKFLPSPPRITVLEARGALPSIGGTINIVPNGVRYLDALGVLPRLRARQAGAAVRAVDIYALTTGSRVASLAFSNEDGSGIGRPPHTAMRLRREDLLHCMLEAVQALDNAHVEFSAKVSAITPVDDQVTVTAEDGHAFTGKILLGCDGIHSAVRRSIDPDRKAQYTGICAVSGFTDKADGLWHPAERDMSFITAQNGSFFSTYYEQSRTKLAVAGVWETVDVGSRDGWQVKGKDQEAIVQELKDRFGHGATHGVDALIDAVSLWTLYPVYKLPAPTGAWSTGRIMLLGDAAHAMSPQGESTTFAMEDAVVFARVLAHWSLDKAPAAFQAYESNRRERMQRAYQEADMRWNGNRDGGWLKHQMLLWMMPAWLWWTSNSRRAVYEEDLTQTALVGVDGVDTQLCEIP